MINRLHARYVTKSPPRLLSGTKSRHMLDRMRPSSARRWRCAALSIRAPLRDLMDWNGPKVDYVIATSTRAHGFREECGENERARERNRVRKRQRTVGTISRSSLSRTPCPFVHEEWDPTFRIVLRELVVPLPSQWQHRLIPKTISTPLEVESKRHSRILFI